MKNFLIKRTSTVELTSFKRDVGLLDMVCFETVAASDGNLTKERNIHEGQAPFLFLRNL